MPIFRYTIIKYLKSYSTWIIVGFSMLLIIILGGWVAFSSLETDRSQAARDYTTLSIALVAGITGFLAIFSSIFAGFKAAAMYKDEVEDGTFLVMLSKPITRSKIIFYKWLALITSIIIYTFILSLSFLFAILIFDTGNKIENLNINGIPIETLRSKIVPIAASMWGILIVASLIFSSIALLISTKVSVGSTIGISIGLGVIIPMTAMIGMFTQKPAYAPIGSSSVTALRDLEDQLPDEVGDILGDIDFNALIEGSPEAPTLYNIGLSTGDTDAYRYAWLADISFQVNTLSLIASNQAIPNAASALISGGGATATSGFGISSSTYIKDASAIISEDYDSNQALLDAMIINSWNNIEPIRNLIISQFQQFFSPSNWKNENVKLTPYLQTALANININLPIDTNISTIISNIRGYVSSYLLAAPLDKANFLNVLNQFISFYYLNVASFQPANETTNKDDAENLLNMLDNVISPLSWVSSRSISNFIVDKEVEINTAASPINPGNDVPLIIIDERLNENNVYQALVSAMDQGFELTKIEAKNYANKYYILYAYLAIALILVPLAYFIVRRQDFR